MGITGYGALDPGNAHFIASRLNFFDWEPKVPFDLAVESLGRFR
jgi:hypothetical protein